MKKITSFKNVYVTAHFRPFGGNLTNRYCGLYFIKPDYLLDS
jgi:hypothetical protein